MTNETKHTPGKWAVKPWDTPLEDYAIFHKNQSLWIKNDEDKRIAVVVITSDVNVRDVAEANARLISYAPELLEALEEMVEHYCPKCYVCNGLPQRCNKRGCVLPKYNQLIARAKGGTDE